MSKQTQQIPDGMMENAKGHFVPKSSIEDIDLARDEMVGDVVSVALNVRHELAHAKAKMLGDIKAFIDLSLEQYGVKQGGKKGNVTLYSFDGNFKICVAQQDTITFDERLQGAKTLIDECVQEWSADSNDNIKALITDAFHVDKQKQINTARVLGLRKLKINDPKWLRAMEAISDSLQVVATKEYIRLYERQVDGSYKHFSLDFSAV